jgi:L-histidine Nalpha-methyltransferase
MPDVFAPARTAFERDVLAGLSQPEKRLPCKYFYDEEGSALFDRITELDAYYPTRTELAILQAHASEMAEAIGPRAALIEFGSGSSVKTRLLLDALPDLAAYVPVDISEEHLLATAEALRTAYPDLPILPLPADYTETLTLPDLPEHRRRVVYFPGSTIGNFERDYAEAFLERAARLAGRGGGLLIGVDLVKDPAVLERAYDDEEGVTAAFNRNLLERINRELGADFPAETFEHRAVWNEEEERIEMYLVSTAGREVEVAGRTFRFTPGETIHTEHSHKYTPEGFVEMARHAGFEPDRQWLDPQQYFAVFSLRVPG